MVRCRERGRSSPLRASRERRVFPNRHLKVGTPETGYWRPGVLAALTLTKPNRTARPSAPPGYVYITMPGKGLTFTAQGLTLISVLFKSLVF